MSEKSVMEKNKAGKGDRECGWEGIGVLMF